MSTQRKPTINPDWKATARGPNGRGLCKWCLKEVPPGSRTWCSKTCVNAYLSRDPRELRKAARKRDKGVCQACGLDTVALRRFLDALPHRARTVLREALKVAHRSTLYDADHIVPVVEGGGGCEVDNIQTLCAWCHRAKTAKMPRRKKCPAKKKASRSSPAKSATT